MRQQPQAKPQVASQPCPDLTELHNEIKQLKDAVAAIPEGPKGDPGEKGEKGDKGDPGPPLELTDELIAEIARRLPPIYPQWIDNNGLVIDEIPDGVRLGQTMPLRIEVLIRQAVRDELNARAR